MTCLATSVALAQPAPAALTVSSPTVKSGEMIPAQHTADGMNISPAVAWSGAPATTKSFALVCEDPDVLLPPTNPQPFVHWVIYNIPATAKGLPENVPIDPAAPMPAAIAGAIQGPSGFRRPIYRGPAPPPGKPHHYHFIVYALDIAELPPGLTRAQLTDAMTGHIVGHGELVAIYERKPKPPGR
jgi:Raf kinase inhibitor-like YbhB/YbcL family protein